MRLTYHEITIVKCIGISKKMTSIKAIMLIVVVSQRYDALNVLLIFDLKNKDTLN